MLGRGTSNVRKESAHTYMCLLLYVAVCMLDVCPCTLYMGVCFLVRLSFRNFSKGGGTKVVF